MDHAKTITTITEAVSDVPGIDALFLSGSFATGHADGYSDIDFILVTDKGATDAVAASWKDAVTQTGEIILWWDRVTVPVLINAITADWTRIDLIILKPDQISRYSQDRLTPLFDHQDTYSRLTSNAAVAGPNPVKFQYDVEEFIKILGLLHLVKGRQEYNNGVLGVFHLRNKLVDLLIAETAEPVRGGMLHLNRLITDKQQELLASLPPPVATWDGIVTCHLAYAAAYLPRARLYADKIGATWPAQFEAATWAMLDRSVGISKPAG